ncbi:putative transposase, partial [Shigella flexneri 6603-63]
AVERRFGNDLPSSPVEWLTDNGSCYGLMKHASSPGCWDLNRRTRGAESGE